MQVVKKHYAAMRVIACEVGGLFGLMTIIITIMDIRRFQEHLQLQREKRYMKKEKQQ